MIEIIAYDNGEFGVWEEHKGSGSKLHEKNFKTKKEALAFRRSYLNELKKLRSEQ